jgi:cyanophycin synthetase
MFKIKHETTFFGANPFSTNPVLVASITLSDGDGFRSIQSLKQGCLRLHEIFPEWFDAAAPSIQDPIAQIANTAARWALASLNEVRGFLHDAGAVPIPGGARLWLGFHHQNVSLSALKLALDVLTHAGLSTEFDRNRVDSSLASLWDLCRRHHPDYQARILMEGARARNIPVLPFITESRFWQYGWGCASRVFLETASNADGYLGGELQRSKVLTKLVISALGFPTPICQLVSQIGELPKSAEVVGWPCVVKPVSLAGGKGVTAGINTIIELETAFLFARRYTSEAIMVEAFIPGDDHRLMVLNGRFFAAVRREPSSVIGDGNSTVAQLIGVVNRFRSANMVKSRYLRPIASDGILERHLAGQGVSVSTVLEFGRRITLRSNANLSTGGVSVDVTNRIHPHVAQMAETVAQTMGLATAGVDFITTDIGKSWQEGGALIEVNATPGADVMIAAGRDSIAVASALLGEKPARIPIQLVVVSQSDLPRTLSYLQNLSPVRGFGWTCHGHAAIEGMALCLTRSGPWSAVDTLLRHTLVTHACLVCSVEEIVRHGMPVDKVDHVALCNDEQMPLPFEWLRVLTEHTGSIKQCSSWVDLRFIDLLQPNADPRLG